MYASFFRRFLFPLYEEKIAGRGTLRYINEYQSALALDSEQIESIKVGKLKKLLTHAYQQCDYYKQAWDDIGFDPALVTALSDIDRLPIIDKDTIRENYEGFVAKDFQGKNILKATGGSSGVPFQFELDQESNERRQAVMWRGYGWLGAGLGVKSLYYWGAHIAPVGKKTKIKDVFYNAFYHRKIMNTFKMNDSNIGEYVDALNRYKPKAVVAYATPLVTIAEYINKNNLKVHQPETILTGAEALHEFQREIIEKAFKTSVFNTYGCREFMLIAAECKVKDGLHVNHDHLLVDLVDENGKLAKSGDVLVTDLHNYGFPLIRYRNGDVAEWAEDSACVCGSPLPKLAAIHGRTVDVVKTPDGKQIPGLFFPHLLKDYKNVKRFQVIQERLDLVVLKLILADKNDDGALSDIRRLVEENLGDLVTLNIDVVDVIELTESGKHKVMISKL